MEWGVKGLNPNDKIEDLYIESPPSSSNPVAFSLFNTAPGPGVTRVTLLLDRSAGSKTDPIEMTVIDRALCAVDLAR